MLNKHHFYQKLVITQIYNCGLPFYNCLLWSNFWMKRLQSWGLGDDGGNGPTAIEATPWTSVHSIQCVVLSVQHYIALFEKCFFKPIT